MKLTDEQVVKALAGREGYTRRYSTGIRILSWFKGQRIVTPPDYLHSRDALQPVLDGMSESERVNLIGILRDEYHAAGNSAQFGSFEGLIWILTIPARTLAHAIAQAIHEAHKTQP